MSHLDAPLRSRRHHPSSDVFSRREAGVVTPEDTFSPLGLDLDDSSPPSSSSFAAGTRSLKSLLLPVQIELRRVFRRQRRRDLPSDETDADERAPKRFKTDSSFHLHRLHHLDGRQSRPATSTAQLGAALANVGTGTDCQAFADRYGDGRRTQVLLGSTRRLAAPVTTPLSPAQASALSRSVIGSVVSEQFSQAASVVASRASVASASRAVIMSSVDSIFSEAASVVASREGLLPTVTAASSASSASSSSSTLAPSAISSASSSSSSSSSATSSSAAPFSTADPARSNHNRIAKIVGPSVAIPLGLLLLAALLVFCLKRRRRRKTAGYTASGRSTPGGLGPISHPQPLQSSAGGGGMREYGAMGAGAGLARLGAAAATSGRAGEPGSSQESLGPTPSAIGVAFSEPRTKWGRRSLVDVLAGGVRGANSGSNTPEGSAGDGGNGHQRGLSTSSSFGGRQPSIRSSASIPSELRGVGGYNIYGYQPGQPRPVMSMTSPLSSHYDPFGPGAIVPVPESARSIHPVSSDEGSISGYSEGPGGSGSGGERSGSGESFTAVLAPPLAAGYAHSRQAQQSRTTQQTSEGEQGYWTADAGQSSVDTHTQEAGDYDEAEEELSGLSGSPQEEAVDFGSGSSSSGSRAGRSSEDPNATPRMDGSRTSTPRLGMGHGSVGARRNDGTGSWWNA
ncbi:hypothetical protein Rt10032_c01g0208 [Rhodotorula toruloides]|uniref:Uncharacterized protein n=1 Tax=Rhodotorula toruloides TaxID=5286 RepID=A0A511K775_RHOTO|nr:hypothetical protein Rt10032_c01g0208 [Rhodotorula toruloides]